MSVYRKKNPNNTGMCIELSDCLSDYLSDYLSDCLSDYLIYLIYLIYLSTYLSKRYWRSVWKG